MPGMNQRGPMNEGPLTGKGRGRCVVGGYGQEDGGRGAAGYGRKMGRRMGSCQQFDACAGAGAGRDFVAENVLQSQVDLLERELAEIKKQMELLTRSSS